MHTKQSNAKEPTYKYKSAWYGNFILIFMLYFNWRIDSVTANCGYGELGALDDWLYNANVRATK